MVEEACALPPVACAARRADLLAEIAALEAANAAEAAATEDEDEDEDKGNRGDKV
jgi:hypothetical protein